MTPERFKEANRAWAARQAQRLPGSFRAHVLDGWDARYGTPAGAGNGSVVALANRFATAAAQEFGNARAARAYDEQAITEAADNYARLCERMDTREARASFAAWFGIEPPAGPRMTDAAACARMADPQWWRRQLRKVWTRQAENAMRRAGIIRKGRAPYASNEAVTHRANRARRTREWLESRAMVNADGEQLELLALHEKSLANPALRRGEFMCRMRGFEEIAHELGHVALFFTLTAPSAFHAWHAGGGVNAAWEAADRPRVRDAQAWLRKQWARARAKLARLSIAFYGFRVAEPHHDATPHWHAVLFVAPAHADALRAVLLEIWRADYRHEMTGDKAREARAKCITIDPEEGSATGYVAKYVSKNIDGAGAIGGELSDETGEPVSEGVARVAAWAACHGIRQFQQIGGPPVGLWRELRRKRDPVEFDAIERARTAADRGDWRAFVDALGGMERARRRVRSVREKYRREVAAPMVRYRGGPRGGWRRRPAMAAEMPAVWLDRADPRTTDKHGREVFARTRYGEDAPRRACGVVAVGLMGRYQALDTRPHRWRIEKKCSPIRSDSSRGARPTSGLGPVAITVRGSDAAPARVQASAPAHDRDFSWIASIPYRPPAPPGAKSGRVEH